jgi:hypothetical protein
MQPKPWRVTVNVEADTLEEAIADLQSRFLRATKTGCKVVRQATEFNVADLTDALIEDWKSGKVGYDKGEITLSFAARDLADAADLVVYKPQAGDRFLYSKRLTSDAPRSHTQQLGLAGIATSSSVVANDEVLNDLRQTLHLAIAAFAELLEHQRAVESRLQSLILENTELKHQLEAQAITFAQIVANQINSTALHFSQRLDELKVQIDALMTQVQQLSDLEVEDEPFPKTEAEWLHRIKSAWGTVGDYEQYSASYREANAETPLYFVPDWIALCELDWARKLSPTLAVLYQLIYEEEGIGYEGANILHQFGRHLDPQTGEPYYVYRRSGFTPYDALWQTVRNPQYSWLPEIRLIATRVAKRHPDLFQLFGWEPEAIASLESVVERAQREQQSTYDSRSPQTKKPGNSLSDHLAVLNMGPFSAITIEAIKRAYRQAMKTAHPDAGGSKEQAQRVNEAYEAVLQHYFPKAT